MLPLLVWPLLNLAVTSLATVPAYPLKQSANGRYLVDSVGAPVLIVGDAPHSILANIGTNGWQTYFQNRGSNGVNNVWIELLCDEYTFGYGHESAANYGKDFYGNNPFTSTLSGSYYDLTTPNPAYWSNVDYVVAQAASNGVQCFLTPLDQGGWTQTSLANGTDQCYAYGQFLGNRYKNSPNIIWNLGNDFQYWTNATNEAMILAIADGIRSADSNHLLTVELNFPVSQSMNDPNWASRISINGVYTYYGTYDESQLAYNITNLPTLFLEAHYEDSNIGGALGTPNVLRRQEYWSLLSGCLAGHMYGNYWIERFDPAWVSHLDSTGMVQLTYFKNFFSSRTWYKLVPDTNHVLVTAGYGTYNGNLQPGNSDYATAARTTDGTLAVVYTPVNHTLTVALSGFTGNVTAQWFDPTANTFTAIAGSPLANTGTYNFTPPANNAAGDSDWVLLLETAPISAFSAAPTNGVGPLLVSFKDNSTGTITNNLWDFGDGSTTNFTAPTDLAHLYSTGGVYTVKLIASGPAGVSTNTQTDLISVLESFTDWQLRYFGCTDCPQAQPDADPLGKGLSNTNQFLAGLDPTNSASVFRIISVAQDGIDMVITWRTAGGRTNAVMAGSPGDAGYNTTDFQDISGPIVISGTGDMVTNYVDVGGATNGPSRFYRVWLMPATNGVAAVASFTAWPTNGAAPLLVSFTDTSTGPINSSFWDFGDGSLTNFAAPTDVTHLYSTSGVYTVTLVASNAAGVSTATQTNLISVLEPFAAWQLKYFGCTNCPAAAGTADPDGDGANNADEFLAGTVPTNAASVFRIISVAQNGHDIVITWQTAGGRTNAVQAGNTGNDGYRTNSLQDISGSVIISGAGDVITNYVDVGGATNTPARFYRVRLAPAGVPPVTPFQIWQSSYFGCTNCPQAAATADPDGDGQDNQTEFLTGTDPTNGASAFRIVAVAREGDNIRVTWDSGAGRTNLVESADGLISGYSAVSPQLLVGGSGVVKMDYVHVGGATNTPVRFYRVRWLP
jgi:PKD repeat protein